MKQQEYYGETEELFDPLTKIFNTNIEQNLALGEQTLRAIDWQNQKLDEQTKMIHQAGSQFNEALMKSNEAIMKSNKAVEEARGKPGIIVDKDTAHINNLVTIQSNPQLKFLCGNLDIGEFEMNGVKLTHQEKSFIVKKNFYEFSDGFIKFLTKPNVTYSDIEEEQNKIKRFLLDIGYDIGKSN